MSKTIVMIHGMWGSGNVWSDYKQYFESQGYQVITPTLRFHGNQFIHAAPAELGRLSILDYANDLEKEIRALNEKPIIMGHSMGGLIAQILASRGLAAKLVLLTPAPPAGILALRLSSIRTFMSVLGQWGFWRKPMRLSFNEAKYGIMNALTPDQQVEEYGKYSFESGHAAFEIAFWTFDANKATYVDTRAVSCPVLVISAGKDRIVPVSVVSKIAQKYQKATDVTYRKFTNFGHAIHQQQGWQEIADFASDWIKKH
jgi:non-heme chloroperoxidase